MHPAQFLAFCIYAAVIITDMGILAAKAKPPPAVCIPTSQTIYNLSDVCLTPFVKTYASINDTFWQATINPKANERAAWNYIISKMLLVTGNQSCPDLDADPNTAILRGKFKVAEFSSKSKNYCILYEISVIPVAVNETYVTNQFEKGWGFFAVNKNPERPYVHISAPHALFDGVVNDQAAGVFEEVGAKSLTLSGQHRMAYNTSFSKCQDFSQPNNDRYWDVRVTDPAHDNNTLFHAAMIQIYMWQYNVTLSGVNGCPSDRCAWIQFHGMSSTVCKETVMLTAGSTLNKQLEKDPTSTVKRLYDAIIEVRPDWMVGTPGTSNCIMTGGTNIFARIVNGVPIGQECDTVMNAQNIKGAFIHIEQQAGARRSDYWSEAIVKAFPAKF